MKSALDQIYYSEFAAGHDTTKSQVCQKQREAFCQQRDIFLKKLKEVSPSLQDECSKLLEEQHKQDILEPSEIFAEGFSMAVRLMVETLTSV